MPINAKSESNKPSFSSGDRIRQQLGEDFVNEIETNALNRLEAGGTVAAAVRADCPTTAIEDEGNKNSVNIKDALKNIVHSNGPKIGEANTTTYASYAKQVGLDESAVRSRNADLVSRYNNSYPDFKYGFRFYDDYLIRKHPIDAIKWSINGAFYDIHSLEEHVERFGNQVPKMTVIKNTIPGFFNAAITGINCGYNRKLVTDIIDAKFTNREDFAKAALIGVGLSFATTYITSYNRQRFVGLWNAEKYSRSEIADINNIAKIENAKYALRTVILTNVLPTLATKVIMSKVVKDAGKYNTIITDCVHAGTKIVGSLSNDMIQKKIATKQRNALQTAIDNHVADTHKIAAKAMVNSAIASKVSATTIGNIITGVGDIAYDTVNLGIASYKESHPRAVKSNESVIEFKEIPVEEKPVKKIAKVTSNNKIATKKVASN